MANELKQGGVPGFGRAMRCEEVSGRGRTNTYNKRSGGSCNESVCHYGDSPGRGTEAEPAHGGNFEAAYAAENTQRITQAFAVQIERAPNGGKLPDHAGIVGGGSDADHGFGTQTGQGRCNGAGRCCVSNAHLAKAQQIAALSQGVRGEFDPDQFLRDMAGYVGLGAGVDYAVLGGVVYMATTIGRP